MLTLTELNLYRVFFSDWRGKLTQILNIFRTQFRKNVEQFFWKCFRMRYKVIYLSLGCWSVCVCFESISSEMCFSGWWSVNNGRFRGSLAALTSHLQKSSGTARCFWLKFILTFWPEAGYLWLRGGASRHLWGVECEELEDGQIDCCDFGLCKISGYFCSGGPLAWGSALWSVSIEPGFNALHTSVSWSSECCYTHTVWARRFWSASRLYC